MVKGTAAHRYAVLAIKDDPSPTRAGTTSTDTAVSSGRSVVHEASTQQAGNPMSTNEIRPQWMPSDPPHWDGPDDSWKESDMGFEAFLSSFTGRLERQLLKREARLNREPDSGHPTALAVEAVHQLLTRPTASSVKKLRLFTDRALTAAFVAADAPPPSQIPNELETFTDQQTRNAERMLGLTKENK